MKSLNLEIHPLNWDLLPYFGTIKVEEPYPDVVVKIRGENNTRWGGRIQFQAIVTGTDNKEVKWSLAVATGAGTISQQGLYVAPHRNCRNTVIATSLANPNKSARMQILVMEYYP